MAPLQRRDIEVARQLCATDPVAAVVPAMQLEHAAAIGKLPAGSLWAVRTRDDGVVALVWNGANLIPLIPEPNDDVLAVVAQTMVKRLSRPSALVGTASVVLDLWGRVEDRWGPAREIRAEQWLMTLTTNPLAPPPRPPSVTHELLALEAVRVATLEDYAQLLPACVDMFKSEVGYDPMAHGRVAYEDRLKRLIRGGRSFVQFGSVDNRRQVVFKAEIGVLGGGVAEMQGVWVHHKLRGQGLGRAGIAATADKTRATLAPTVSLYVNSFNTRAIDAYLAVGFERVGTFATVML